MNQERMCGQKKRFSNEQSALEAAFRINAKRGDCQGIYRCPFCHHWHTGHSRNAGVKVNRKFSFVRVSNEPEPIRESAISKLMRKRDSLKLRISLSSSQRRTLRKRLAVIEHSIKESGNGIN